MSTPASTWTTAQGEPSATGDAYDVAVVGAGIVGLAVARELGRRDPARRIAVLEREPDIGAHQTSHNSGVIHAGIYYAPGSLKARLCVRGGRALLAYAAEKGVPARECGKLIVATSRAELPRLRALHERGRANGLTRLRWLEGAEIAEVEPHAAGVAALYSPTTGVADFHAVARALADDLRAAGQDVLLRAPVTALDERAREVRVSYARGELSARAVVACAGGWSDRLARAAGAGADPRIVPFRGAYWRLARPELVRALLYPVPDPALPFLGVHFTRDVHGEVHAGPTALLAGARDAYALRRVRVRDLAETVAWPGTRRVVRRFWRAGLGEVAKLSRAGAAREGRRLLPELRAADLEPMTAGVRAQAVTRDGALLDDFAFSETPRTLHVRNAPSPAATSALAIAAYVADRVEARLA